MSPRRPKKPCAKVNCKELVEAGKRYCPEHEREYRKCMNKEQDSKRGTAADRGYGANWRRLRKMVLNAEPLCRHCWEKGLIRAAEEVDHIDGNAWNLAWDNLQPLCKSCHSKKTTAEQGAGWGNK